MIANCGHLFKIMPLNGVTINYGWGMLKCLMMATFLCPPPLEVNICYGPIMHGHVTIFAYERVLSRQLA